MDLGFSKLPSSTKLSLTPDTKLVLHVLALKDSAVTARPGGIQGKGVEMQMYAKRATLSLSTRAWEAVPYFHSNSLGFPDTDDLLALSLTVPTADEVDALIEVLSRCRIEPWGMARPLDLRDSNQFELYKMASTLQLNHLVLECEAFIASGLCGESFIYALQHALQLGRDNLVAACYTWLKRTGGDVHPLGPEPLTLDIVSGCIVKGTECIKLTPFQRFAREEWECKLPFHEPVSIEGSEPSVACAVEPDPGIVFTDGVIAREASPLDTTAWKGLSFGMSSPDEADLPVRNASGRFVSPQSSVKSPDDSFVSLGGSVTGDDGAAESIGLVLNPSVPDVPVHNAETSIDSLMTVSTDGNLLSDPDAYTVTPHIVPFAPLLSPSEFMPLLPPSALLNTESPLSAGMYVPGSPRSRRLQRGVPDTGNSSSSSLYSKSPILHNNPSYHNIPRTPPRRPEITPSSGHSIARKAPLPPHILRAMNGSGWMEEIGVVEPEPVSYVYDQTVGFSGTVRTVLTRHRAAAGAVWPLGPWNEWALELTDILNCKGSLALGALHRLSSIGDTSHFSMLQSLFLRSSTPPTWYEMRRQRDNRLIMVAFSTEVPGQFVFSRSAMRPAFHSQHYLGFMKSHQGAQEFSVYDYGVGNETRGLGTRVCEVLPELQRCKVARLKVKSRAVGGKPCQLQVSLLSGDSPAELVVKPPSWNKRDKCWTLDFNGRARLPSKKNVQLVYSKSSFVRPTDSDRRKAVRFLLGKLSKDEFALDFSSPLSPVQAFACALSMFVKPTAAASLPRFE